MKGHQWLAAAVVIVVCFAIPLYAAAVRCLERLLARADRRRELAAAGSRKLADDLMALVDATRDCTQPPCEPWDELGRNQPYVCTRHRAYQPRHHVCDPETYTFTADDWQKFHDMLERERP